MNLDDLPIITFEQYWHSVEWAAKQIFVGSTLDEQVRNIGKPDRDICILLDKMHDAFYPNETSSDEVVKATEHLLEAKCDSENIEFEKIQLDRHLPWVLHQALYDLTFKNDPQISEKCYYEVITRILTKEWLLTWHWRAVLPSLRDWDQDPERKLIIQISHVRKWEMLLCYTVTLGDLETYKNISEIPLKRKNLLRAPLFGISHRLKGWDTYRLFYQPFIKEYIERKYQEKKESSFNTNLAYVFGRHDCYYIVHEFLPTAARYKWTLRPFMVIEPELALINKDILGSASYHKPTDLLDIPSFSSEHEGIPQLLSSDHYCEAILELTEVLNDPTAKSVLLIAPPGSGKEKLAESAFYCRDQPRPSGEFVATTLAGLNAVEAAKLLFSVDDRLLKSADPKNLLADYEPGKQSRDGLVLRALGGALFIDEIDKTDRSIRDLLLRVLESGEITVPGSSQILKIPPNRIPLYIFAGSMNRTSMFQESPPDFWTRISHVIEVAHPLGIDDLDKSKEVVKEYLWMFWCKHVKDFMEKKGVQNPADAPDKMKPLNDFYLALYKFLIARITVDFASGILADEISGRGKPLISIRTLRSIVARSVFKFVDILLYSKFDDHPIEIFKANCKVGIQTPDEWFGRLGEIIENEIKRKLSPHRSDAQTIVSIEFSVVDTFRTAIRLGTALAQ